MFSYKILTPPFFFQNTDTPAFTNTEASFVLQLGGKRLLKRVVPIQSNHQGPIRAT